MVLMGGMIIQSQLANYLHCIYFSQHALVYDLIDVHYQSYVDWPLMW